MNVPAGAPDSVQRLLDMLKNRPGPASPRWFVPERWNPPGYQGGTTHPARPHELEVDPYDFFAAAIQSALQLGSPALTDAARNRPLAEDIIYGMLVRSFTAWPHLGAADLSSGTFLKAMALLPLLERYDVTLVYLLPVFATGDRYRKGQLGSPYAISNIYRLDPSLHDPLLGECSDELLNLEFRAFVDLCHWLGMKVVLDFAFRTAARDSALIADHPDWFCWIRKEDADAFRPPSLGDGKAMRWLDDATLRELYTSPGIPAYLAQFTEAPNRIDPQRWAGIHAQTARNPLDVIEEEFGVTTVPGFSDIINDQQPPWTDATYLRFYFDTAPAAAPYVPEHQSPFVMQDGASLDRYPGTVPNEELWDYTIGVLPYYRQTFGIDGARIDMAHAMPSRLNALMVQRIREVDPKFLLWSEELGASRGGQAQSEGFDLLSGFTYDAYKRIHDPDFASSILRSTFLASPIPVVASLETPDTPRSALIHPDAASLKLALTLNAFMPNAVPSINSGQELLEVQPMNLGLDNTEEGRWVLPRDDPMYGRLAFFDPAWLHWGTPETFVDRTLHETLHLRRRYHALLASPANFVKQPEPFHSGNLVMLCYHDVALGGLVVAANCSLTMSASLAPLRMCPLAFSAGQRAAILYDTHGPGGRVVSSDEELPLQPCQAVVMKLGE
ncbi:MAG: alpha amylase [Candidatus Cryosericum sp.]